MNSPADKTADQPSVDWASVGDRPTFAGGLSLPTATFTAVAPPGYTLSGELGRGGMGVVYHATQTALNRPVALKMILSGDHAHAKERVRFLAEAEAMAAVRHPHVVPVYDFGTAGGRPFLALEYLPGGSLSGKLRAGPLPVAEAAALVEKLAGGVQAAHDLGIVHRDLKPGNVLLDEAGEPKITDFGLAKRAGGSDLTATHAVMGTPAYMAPEQARGNAKFVGPAADVYALGAILFECLAGRPPFVADDPVRLLLAAAEQPAPDVRRFAPGVPRDVAVVVRKCLEKEPAARYPTAAALADDLRRFLDGRPVRARPIGAGGQLWRWARRNPAPAGLLAVVALLLTVGGIGSAVAAARLRSLAAGERAARREADDRADQATRARDDLAAGDYAQRIALAELEVSAGNYVRAGGHLAGCPDPLRRWEWQFLRNAVTLARAGTADRGHTNVVWALAFAPDGRVLTVSADGTARITDPATGVLLKTFPIHTEAGLSCAWSADGRLIATAGIGRGAKLWERVPRQEVKLWDAATGALRQTFVSHTAYVNGLAFSPDGSRLVSASWDGTCRVYDTAAGTERTVFRGHVGGGGHGATFLPDGRRVATAGRDRTLRLWEADTGAELAVGRGHLSAVSKVAVSPDGKLLATCGMDGDARLWDADTLAPVGRPLTGHTQPLFGLAWHPSGGRLATSGMDMTVKLWEPTTGRELLTLRGHQDVVWDVAFSPDGHRLASASHDDTWRVWDGHPDGPAEDRRYRDLLGSKKPLMAVAVGPGGAVAAGGFDQTVRVWPAGGGPARELAGHADAVAGLAFAPDGPWLLSAGWDKSVRRWDLATGAETWSVRVDNMPQGLALRPGGAELAVPDWFGRVQVLSAATGKLRLTLDAAHWPYPCYGLAYSADGKQFATGGGDRLVKLWDADTGRLLRAFTGHEASVFGVAVLPGGKVASGSWDRTVRVWDAATGRVERVLTGHTARVYAVRGSADGRTLYSAGEDNAVRAWDVATGREVGRRDHPAGVYCLDLSPDGRMLAVGQMAQADGVRVWSLAP